MKRFLAVALAPLFAGFLCAGQTTETQTTTTKTTTYSGTLVDAACRTTHTEHSETTTNPDQSTTTSTTKTDKVDCPVTTTTTTFGIITPEGKYMRFDEPSNTKVVEIVKSNKAWHRYVNGKEPLKVRVVGAPDGDTLVVESIK